MSSLPLYSRLYEALPQVLVKNFSEGRLPLLEKYFRLVLEGNKSQNLTRIVNEQEFWDSNVLDVLHLLSLKGCEGTPVDLGSGAGIPGLLYEIISGNPCILLESEKTKSSFLSQTIDILALKSHALPVRAEDYFATKRDSCWIMSRATANINKIWNWTRKCSTWNNITLFKSRGWEQEWNDFESDYPRKLKIVEKIDYTSGKDEKFRTIVRIERIVPRGTIKN